MELRKRILAFALSVLFVLNSFPEVYADAARGDALILTGDIMDAIYDVEYGLTDAIYQFDDTILAGVENGDEVHLVADAVYDSIEVGETNITLTNFRLEGVDAAYYTAPTIMEPVIKQINIIANSRLTLTDDIVNVIGDIEYGLTDTVYRFDEEILSGVIAGDEAYLIADAAYNSTEVGEATITLTNFRLEGTDAACYTLPAIIEPVTKQINVIDSNRVMLTDDISNAISDIEYGSTDTVYQFDDTILGGVEDGDEVHLVADATYTSTNAGTATITLTNFRFEGADAAGYIVPSITEPVEKQIHITQKVIKIAPAKTYVYYGQTKPSSTSEIADYSSQIIPGDTVNLSAEFSIQYGNEIGEEYSIWRKGRITCDNNNYKGERDDTVKFSVLEYNPEAEAVTSTNDYAGVYNAILYAPEGFLISKENQRNSVWKSYIEIDLQETQNGSETYYLRCNDMMDTEYYQAISVAKTYHYTSIQTLPEIESIKIEKVEGNSILNFLTFGVFGNGSVNVTVEAVGTVVEQETTIFLGEEGAYESKVTTSELREDGKYHYTAVFTYDVPQNSDLKAYAVNSSGSGSVFSSLSGISDEDNHNKTVDSKPFALENKIPEVEMGDIESDSIGNTCIITISDVDSGIAKVEYGWDLDMALCDEVKNLQTGHYCGFRENNYTGEYVNYAFDNSSVVNNMSISLELKYDDSVWAKNNQHTVYVRVTDNAGNVSSESLQDPVGSDMLPPNVTSVEIRKAETSVLESVLRFLTFGSFSNDSVEIAIVADDNESLENLYASGICSVFMNGRIMTKNDVGEYVLTVTPDEIINAMSITVEDNCGWSSTVAVLDIPDEMGIIKSNDLIIENDAPTISWDFSFNGHIDNTGKIWYGAGDISETFEIKVSDSESEVKSGLNSLRITDNGATIFEKTDFSSIDVLEYTKTYTVGSFADGSHTIEVTVEDNAGNIGIESQTFYIDYAPPERGIISAVSPDDVTIDDKQWFDKNDVIAFRVDSSDADSGLESIGLTINEQEFGFVDDQIRSGDDGNYILVDTTNIEPDSEHKYTVTGVVTDIANNSLTLEPLVVYKDFENPDVTKFTVENKSDILDKILNVLTFGAYSNDTLILKAYVSDAEFDSGIDYVTVEYEGLDVPKKMTDEGDEIFSVEISAGEEVFESDIVVTAYDKYGKRSISCPNLENAKNGDLADDRFVMIETVNPIMILSLPIGDDVTRTDDETWYNSNKAIELKIQDENSGIRNVNLTVNGIDITSDKNGFDLLKTEATEQNTERNTEEQIYVFDTDYFTAQAGEPADGKYLLYVEITDNAGNVLVYETSYYIDDIMPQIDKFEFVPVTSNGISETAEFIEPLPLDYGFYFKTDFAVTVYISDESPSSGLDEIQYRFVPYESGIRQEEITGTQRITDGKAELTVPKDFKGQIYVEAFDNVENCSGEKTTRAYVVDNAAPNINVIKNVSTSYHDANGNNLYVMDNNITVEITDMVSGIREIGYSQSSEQNSYERKTVVTHSAGYNVGDSLGDGWIVTGVDQNLVTKVTKTFEFGSDDNDVILTFDATDNALNRQDSVKSEKFTVDKTNPIINVTFREDEDGDIYYSQNRVAEITVIDRNFDANLIKAAIANQYGAVPSVSFSQKSITEYVALIDFDEGDYTFDVSGIDLGNHEAIVNFSGGNEKLFYVDKTKPVIEENFASFTDNDTENSFNQDKTVEITVTEHNFDPSLAKLRITRADAGADHNADDLVDVTSEMLKNISWGSSGDDHTISFMINEDAIYQVEIMPSDLAGNSADHRSTVIFEIDKTVPVVAMKNEKPVSADNTEFLDVYTYLRANDSTPTVEFTDLNIDHIKYSLTVYIPDYTSTEAATVIRPTKVYLKEDQNHSGIIAGSKFTLPDFVKDGVYALELTAVDVAGNESISNINTYARIVEQDVLAYIMDSNVEQKTGLYSFQYENGEAISKTPDDFEDIKIFVLAAEDSDVSLVLRDSNGGEYDTNAQADTDDSIYGMKIYNFTLAADFLKENFQNDTDMQLHLTVKSEDSRIDLGKMHIDNVAPTCDVPEDLKSWKWYYGGEDRTITVSNISELIDETQCRVYDNGEEIAFTYSSESNTIAFTLEEGWHNVGIILNDMAGNTYNIQEKSNIHIGYFWLWVIGGVSVTLTSAIAYAVIRSIKKKRAEE